jgi:hypothetical protein
VSVEKKTKIPGVTLTDADDICTTGFYGYITASFAQLRELLGEPNLAGSGDGKVSTEWGVQIDNHDYAMTIHDYKETSAYRNDLPSVEEFRAHDSYSWHISAHSKAGVDKLIAAIEKALATLTATKPETAKLTREGAAAQRLARAIDLIEEARQLLDDAQAALCGVIGVAPLCRNIRVVEKTVKNLRYCAEEVQDGDLDAHRLRLDHEPDEAAEAKYAPSK